VMLVSFLMFSRSLSSMMMKRKRSDDVSLPKSKMADKNFAAKYHVV